MAKRRFTRLRRRRAAHEEAEAKVEQAAPAEEPEPTKVSSSRFERTRIRADVAEAEERLAAAAKDIPVDRGGAPTGRGGTAPGDDLRSAVTDAVTDATPDLGDAEDGLDDGTVPDPTGSRISPSVGGDVLGSVGPDVTPTFDPRPGSVDAAVADATASTGIDPDAKTPDQFAHLRPDSGSAGFVEVTGEGPDPTAISEDEQSERDTLAELGFSDDEIELAFKDPEAFTKLVNEKADRMFLAEHGFSEAEIDAAIADPDGFRAQMELEAFKALTAREESPLGKESEEAIVKGIAFYHEMEMYRDALLANGYTQEEVDDLTSPPRGGWATNDFKPKPEFFKAVESIGIDDAFVADEEEVVSQEEEVVAEEAVVGAHDDKDQDADEPVEFIGGGAEDRGDQNIAPPEEETAEEQQDQVEGEQDTAGSDAEDASRPDSEFKDPRIEKQARDLEEQLGAGRRDPRSGTVDPSRIDVVETGQADPSRIITTDDLAQPVPDGEGASGGTKEPNGGSQSTGLTGDGAINPGRDGEAPSTGAALADDPVVPQIDRDREDPASTDGGADADVDDGSDGDADRFSRIDESVMALLEVDVPGVDNLDEGGGALFDTEDAGLISAGGDTDPTFPEGRMFDSTEDAPLDDIDLRDQFDTGEDDNFFDEAEILDS